MDLGVTLSCCGTLITMVDSHISGLHTDIDNKLIFDGKMKPILKNGTIEEFQKIVDRQTIALSLLLTACNW